jgi:hypothetical protein
MVVTKCTERSFVNNLPNVVASNEMIHLTMENIVQVEYDLRKQPIVRLIERGVYQVAANVCLDSQRQKFLGLWEYVSIRLN